MHSAIRQIILNGPAIATFDLALRTSLTPEKSSDGAVPFARSSVATIMGYHQAAVAGAAPSLQTIPAGVPLFPNTRYIPSPAMSGANPFSVAVSADGISVYVANSGSSDVSHYRRNIDTELLIAPSIATTPAGTNPRSVTVSADGTSVYVVNSGANTISQFSRNVSTGLLTALSPVTLATGLSPYSVAVAPDGTSVYVSNNNAASISQFSRNVSTGLLTALSPATIATGTNPRSVTVSPDGVSVYAANFGANTISQFSRNVSTGLLTALSPATIAAGTNPILVTVAPDGVSVYAANYGSNTVSQYSRNVSTGLLTELSPATIAAGTNPFSVAVSADGASVYTANYGSNTASQFSRNVSTGLLTALSPATITAGVNPISVTVAPDGVSVYVVNFASASALAGGVSQYRRNISTGLLTELSYRYETKFADGTAIPEAALKGVFIGGPRTNFALWTRDLTNAAWVKTTATVAKSATGIDGADNSASTLTATGVDSTVLQTVTQASSDRVFQPYVKRVSGTGAIAITTDNGTTWTDVTAQINSSTYTQVQVSQTVANPVFGFKIAASGDAIAVDYADNHGGVFVASPILTTTAAATRGADVLPYAVNSSFGKHGGGIYLEFTPEHAPSETIFIWGSYVNTSNYTAILHDATNMIARRRIAGINYDAILANAFVAGVTYRIAMSFGRSGANLSINGVLGTASSDNLPAQIGITMQVGADGFAANQCSGKIKNVKFYNKELKSVKLMALTS